MVAAEGANLVAPAAAFWGSEAARVPGATHVQIAVREPGEMDVTVIHARYVLRKQLP